MSAIDTIELLARSEHRVRILDLLCENGTLEKHVLGDRIDASRTTIGRNLDALEEQGWISRTNGTCTITRQGKLVAEAFADLVSEVELTDKLRSFMRWVPDDTLDLDLSLLAESKITLAQPGDPYAMINKQVQLIKETEWYRVVLPFTGLHATEAANEQIVGNGAEGELVVEPDIADLYCSAQEYAELLREMVATERLELFAYDGTLPYSLGVFDDTVQIVVAEDDEPRALLETTNETVREWALERYRSYKRHADGFSVS
ncbi:helix-turn-helix transcriptional regulator [Halococcus qingdaonensis]|uniref:helix-turn-helix transcriptional regulator n=1 Tax=Halococcus qingdaonensis TaxID=224402 RepID=UPI0021172AA7|nr:MarR family transcriptional regulator [Halococcus qingdaonensis]